MSDWSLRRNVIRTAQRTVAAALTHGTSGNVSARSGPGFYVTPTGVLYDVLQPSDIVEMDLDGNVLRSNRRPSSEWRIHRDIYIARPQVNAVVHVHPPFATTIACLRRDLPAVHYMVAAAGGTSIRCAAYATFGTEELSRAVLEALGDRHACLMANHGLVALGLDLDGALRIAVETERIAEVYWRTLAAGQPVILSDEEMARVVARFTDYGQRG